MQCICTHCGVAFERPTGSVNRSLKNGRPLYCSKEHAGFGRRSNPLPESEKKAQKAAYDRERRQANHADHVAQKRAYYYANREKILAQMTAKRPERMAAHVEYCRRPEYREKKTKYDLKHRAQKQFGEFSEAFLLLRDVEKEIEQRANRYEIYQQNGTLNKAQTRRRAL